MNNKIMKKGLISLLVNKLKIVSRSCKFKALRITSKMTTIMNMRTIVTIRKIVVST